MANLSECQPKRSLPFTQHTDLLFVISQFRKQVPLAFKLQILI